MIISQDLSQNNHTKGKKKDLFRKKKEIVAVGMCTNFANLVKKIYGIGEDRCSFYARKEGYFDIW